MQRTARNIRRANVVSQTLPPSGAYSIHRRGRFWAVLDAGGALVCMTVYKRGAEEVIRRLVGRLPS